MPKHSYLLRVLGLPAALVCTCATLALAAQVAPSQQPSPDAPGSIILEATPKDAGSQLPPVVFDHTLHTKGDAEGKACITCHDPADAKNPYAVRGTAGTSGSARENAFHDACLPCHETAKAAGTPAGPQRAECRSCHNAAALPASADKVRQKASAKVDGGMDASMHARHVASPLIARPDNEQDNCATCHHPVKTPVSPGVRYDSCRSCHKPRGSASPAGSPAFADVAHAKCITCHQALMASRDVVLPVTCDSCHAAKTPQPAKAAPRLAAGQPDMVLMGQPSAHAASLPTADPGANGAPPPDSGPDAAAQAPPAPMPPVAFNHKVHEAQTPNCITCHHNTLQKCSACHTPAGGPKGKNISLGTVMHVPTSGRSCVGCHEARKTASPECAGCHAIIPRAKSAAPDCATCHKPVATRTPAPANTPEIRYSADMSMPPRPGLSANADSLPLLSAPNAESRDRDAIVAAIDAAVAAAPETVVIGILSDEFEPSVLPHRAILKNLADGIKKTSPGMLHFHANPYALCASCHHNSPPSATPPSCISCHPKGTGDTAMRTPTDGRPTLKEAYHQQCMTCHTAMRITKPANTDCTSCHADRIASREGER